eukprot:14628022-Heterocapsa_arctica.AAC.1
MSLISVSKILTLGLCERRDDDLLLRGVPGGLESSLCLRGGGGGVGLRLSSSSSASSGSSSSSPPVGLRPL